MKTRSHNVIATAIGATLLATLGLSAPSALAKKDASEIWAIDQSDSRDGSGGKLWIWNAAELAKKPGKAVPEVIDLADAFDAAFGGDEAGECIPGRRPHMIFSNNQPPVNTVVIANVGSGSTLFMDTATRSVVGCVQTAIGDGDPLNTHVAVPAPDDSFVLTTAIGGAGQSGVLYKIKTDFGSDHFALVETLDLATAQIDGVSILQLLGTATARPICHSFTEDGGFAYLTLAGGGLLVVDPGSADGEAMEVVHAYPESTVPGTGCGTGLVAGNRIISTSESGQFGGDDFLLVFQAPPAGGDEFPAPTIIELPGEDAHGSAICEDKQGRLFAHVLMRVSGDVNIVDLQTYEVLDTISLEAPWAVDVKPDLVVASGKHYFATVRGPRPLSAIAALTNPERIPGVAVLKPKGNCKGVKWRKKTIASMVDDERLVEVEEQRVTASDPHGIEVVPILD